MRDLLRFLMLLSLVVWLGGIGFFSLVEAPTVMQVVRDRQLGGAIIGASLTQLHYIGITCGLSFLIISLRMNYVEIGAARFFQLSNMLVLGMLALTLISQLVLLPEVTVLRSGQTTPEVLAQFQRLHRWAVILEAGTLLMGLAVLWQAGRRLRSVNRNGNSVNH
ncbi:MAG: DUF4149 domain-containing protein [Acidobacteriales bacterium]|nr:DUF4149 domain-containing protein [Terriglobales bacterium]